MNKINFFNEVRDKAAEYYEGKGKVSMHEVDKNNGLKKMGICVTLVGGNCGPTVYLDDFYEEFLKGKSFGSVFNDIIRVIDQHLVGEKVDFSFFSDFDLVCDKICFRLISSKRNEEKLKEIPHRLMEDLAVTYFVSLSAMGIEGSVAVNNEIMKIWDATEEDLFEAALDNTPRLYPAEIVPIYDYLEKQGGQNCCPGDVFGYDSYFEGLLVASNEKLTNGASVILYPELLKEVAEHFGSNYYILPSSVHEVIFVKELFSQDEPGTLEDMIKTVNATCVLPEDVLSDSLYYYDRTHENNIKKVEQVRDTMVL
ncbi:DUF5688 family protein [Butyrivibrio sp. AD3002]|uniref:DUF5688 family protein n=1 Tax=Butyrivibrio sp. AD3002 TaxID=1280670 RepID=UPI0003B3BE97|nr:DUF5688 family protein [Butyrivibrio sp. AD3002]